MKLYYCFKRMLVETHANVRGFPGCLIKTPMVWIRNWKCQCLMIRLGIPETMFKPLFMNSPAGFQMFCSNIMFQISTAVRGQGQGTYLAVNGSTSGIKCCEKNSSTRFLRVSFQGISLNPRRIISCIIRAATQSEGTRWLRLWIFLIRVVISIFGSIPCIISVMLTSNSRVLLRSVVPQISSRSTASTNWRLFSAVVT